MAGLEFRVEGLPLSPKIRGGGLKVQGIMAKDVSGVRLRVQGLGLRF